MRDLCDQIRSGHIVPRPEERDESPEFSGHVDSEDGDGRDLPPLDLSEIPS